MFGTKNKIRFEAGWVLEALVLAAIERFNSFTRAFVQLSSKIKSTELG
jgi:hypothetical protein